MPVQMGFYLTFRFDHKPETGCVADLSGNGTYHKSAGIPERIQYTDMRAEFMDALRCPGQVIFFFKTGLFKLLLQFAAAREQSLRLVQRLGADFTDMIDPHQTRAVFALFFIQHRFIELDNAQGRIRSASGGHTGYGAQ